MSICFSSFGNFNNGLKHWFHDMFTLQKYLPLLTHWILSSNEDFLQSRFWYNYFISWILFWLNLQNWELFLTLINLIPAWSVYLSIILKRGSFLRKQDACIYDLAYSKLKIYNVFIILWSNLVITTNIFSPSSRLILKCFHKLFGEKWFDCFPKSVKNSKGRLLKKLFFFFQKASVVTLFTVGFPIRIIFYWDIYFSNVTF